MTFLQFIETYRLRVEAQLRQHLPSATTAPQQLHEAMRYSVLNPGKRMRPLLVYATGLMCQAKETVLDGAAMAVELIHAYSLIHDDLPCMDDDDLRRGLPTCHIQFDEATAVLAGDALQTLAFQLLVEHPMPQIKAEQRLAMLSLLTQASGSLGMGGGQAIDLQATGKSLTLEQLETMHLMKTGALIEASVLMGYLASGFSDPQVLSVLKEYSRAIGLAFQIKDDILDIESDTETLGKPQGSDIAADKVTYPALLGLEGAKQHAEQQYQRALAALEELPYNSELLRSFARHIVDRHK